MESQSNSEEIIVLCPIQDLTKHFVKDHLVAWHDPNIQGDENIQYKTAIESFCQVKTFTDWEEASSFLKSTDTVCSLITSGRNGELLVKETHDISNIFNIFIFCENKAFHQTWAQNYPKIVCVEDDIKQLLQQIQSNIISWQRQESSLRSGLPAFAPIFDARDQSHVDSLHLRLKGLVNFANRAQAKRDFLTLSKAIYPDDVNLADFEANYNQYDMKTMLNWYTKESFLYKATNNCLRFASTDAIQYSRLILRDLETAIKEQYKLKSNNFSGILHRGAFLTQEEWDKLAQNIGKDIEMYGFLSTTKNPWVAQNFVMIEPSKKALITILVPEGLNEGEQGFAEVKEFSDFAIEDEVLFNVRSVFTVLEATSQEIEGVQCRHLVLLYGAETWRHHLAHHNDVIKVSLREPPCCYRCNSSVLEHKVCYVNLGNPEDFVCQKCLKPYLVENRQPLLCLPSMKIKEKTRDILEIKGRAMSYPQGFKAPLYGYRCCKCQKAREETYYKCIDCLNTRCSGCVEEDLGECLSHNLIIESNPFSFWNQAMEKSELSHIETQNERLKQDYSFQQAEIFFQNHEYNKAIEYFKRYIKLSEGSVITSQLGGAFNNLGRVYLTLDKYEEALESISKAHQIYKMVHGEKDLLVALSLSNLGQIFDSLGKTEKALEHYFSALEIWISLDDEVKEKNTGVVTTLNGIGDVYKGVGAAQKALEYYVKALNILRQFCPNSQSSIAESYKKIGGVFEAAAQYQKAMEFFEKALEIEKVIYGEISDKVASSYNEIGAVYLSFAQYEKALECFTKSLEIKRLLVLNEEKRPAIADSLMNIGAIYYSQMENEKALKCWTEALEIYQANNHPNLAQCFTNLGSAYWRFKEYEKAMLYHEKSLKIYKAKHGENHSLVATACLNIGTVANELKDYQKACDNFIRSLNIYLKVCGPNHPSTAVPYSHLGELFNDLGQTEKGLEFFAVALGINKQVYGDKHPTVVKIAARMAHLQHVVLQEKKKNKDEGHGDAKKEEKVKSEKEDVSGTSKEP